MDEPPKAPAPETAPLPSTSERPKVVIEDPHPAIPKNPLKPYLMAASIVAGVLLVGLITLYMFESSQYEGLDAKYMSGMAELDAKALAMADIQGQLTAAQQENQLLRGEHANVTSMLIITKQNLTDMANELTRCQNALVMAQGEIKRLNELETAKCNTMVAETKDDCNLAIEQLFANTTYACKSAVDDYPNATGTDIRDRVEDAVDVSDYKFS